MNKKWSVAARIDIDLHRMFCLISTRFRVSDTQMIIDALEALCDYAIERGRYERPMKMIFDEEHAPAWGWSPSLHQTRLRNADFDQAAARVSRAS